jgi:hypothetical protein
MRRTISATLTVAALALALPALAQALTIQIANGGVVSPPSCPASPCVVVSRTTAVQVKDGSDNGPFVVKQSGRIVSWSVTLGVPSASQIHYFDTHEGGTARASLAVLRDVDGLEYKLVALSPVVHLEPDFGTTARLKLPASIPVIKGDVIALSVPTWLPALALNYPTSTSWRASRGPARCTDVAVQTMQISIGSSAGYDCLYQTALVTYSATEATAG